MRCFWVSSVATCVLLVASAASAGSSLRYCQRPSLSGSFIAISAGVSCRTARRIEETVLSSACIGGNRCHTYGFTCLAVWEGRYDRPFSYTHHAVCRSGQRRVVLDAG